MMLTGVLLLLGAASGNSETVYEHLRTSLSSEGTCQLPEAANCTAVSDCFKESSLSSESVLCDVLQKALSDSEISLKKVEDDSHHVLPRVKPASSSVWGYGFLCVTIISCMSVMGVSVLPFMSKEFYSSMLTGLIGLAVGSLAGSAVFHLIPSAFDLSGSGAYEHHSYLSISLTIFGGAYMFFVIERFLKMFMGYKNKKRGGGYALPVHSHSHLPAVQVGGSESAEPFAEVNQDVNGGRTISESSPQEGSPAADEDEERRVSCAGRGMQDLYANSEQAIKSSFGHMERPQPETRPTMDQVRSMGADPKKAPIATVAWMIIFGDGVHNFIDGLSIGAAFSESILTGISVSIAVLCEEFPHELGDFAVLLNSGMSPKQAMMYNFLSACTCYIGLVIGILLGELDFANQYIFGLAGGMFLYIALVDMIPELNETTDNLAKISSKKALVTFALQNVGILAGICSLYFLAKYQDDIQIAG